MSTVLYKAEGWAPKRPTPGESGWVKRMYEKRIYVGYLSHLRTLDYEERAMNNQNPDNEHTPWWLRFPGVKQHKELFRRHMTKRSLFCRMVFNSND